MRYTRIGTASYAIVAVLTGRVRMIEKGRIEYDETHPSYGELLPDDPRLYSESEIAARR